MPTLPAQKLAAVPTPELEPPVVSTGRPSSVPVARIAARIVGIVAEAAHGVVIGGHGRRAPATQLASSDSPVLAMIIAPASRRFFTSVAS